MELFNENTSVHTPNNCRIVHLVRVLCPWQAVTIYGIVLYKHDQDVPNPWKFYYVVSVLVVLSHTVTALKRDDSNIERG